MTEYDPPGGLSKAALDAAYVSLNTDQVIAGVKHLTAGAMAAGVRWLAPKTAAQGGTDVAQEIAAAYAESGVTEVIVAQPSSSYYPVASTIIVPAGKRLSTPPTANFVPTADVDVFNVQSGATLDGPLVSVNGFTGFSHAAVALYGTSTFGGSADRTTLRNLSIYGTVGSSATATAVLLDSGATSGQQVTFVKGENIRVRGCAVGLKFHAGAGTWVNGNDFDMVLWQTKRGIDFLVDSTGQISGNRVRARGQAVVGAQSILHDQGFSNTFDLFVFDWDSAVGSSVVSITLDNTTSADWLTTNEPANRVTDLGWNNTVNSTGTTAVGRLPVRSLGAVGGTTSPARYGTQDDWLVFAADRGDVTVSQTAGTALTSGSLSNLFNPDAALAATWSDTGDHTVTATWATGIRGQVYGIVFASGADTPTHVKCEVQKSGAWVTLFEVTANKAQALEVFGASPNDFGITGVRWTFGGTSSAVVERLWLFEQRSPGRAWASRHAPAFTGTTATTAPAAGAGAALPATPAGYFTVNINGTDRKVAYY